MSKTVFFGTPEAAVASLRSLVAFTDVDTVITRSDKPRGRSGRPMPSPVKEAALALGLSVEEPEGTDDLLRTIERTKPDLGLVVAYGRLLPPNVLAAVPLGILNVHFSLLPRWRGAAPVAHAILAGDESTGVSLIQIDEGLDTGPIVATSDPVPIGGATRGQLTVKLSNLGAEIVTRVVPEYLSGTRGVHAQDDAEATMAPMLHRDQARLDVAQSATLVRRHIKAFSPKPGAWAHLDGSPFRILDADRLGRLQQAQPGVVTHADGAVWLNCGDRSLQLLSVQPSGRRVMDAPAWWHGRQGATTQLM